MTWTLSSLEQQLALELDQSASAPTEGGADWNVRMGLINRSQQDWAETYGWSVLKKQFNGVISTSTGNASYSLPADFRKPDGFPKVAGDEYAIVDISSQSQYLDSDKYVNFLGNDRDGRVMYIHGGTLSSGASVQFTYFASPASLSTGTHQTACPDPSFLVQRTLYYWYKAREDGRFLEAKQEADRILARLLENENTPGRADIANRVPTWEESRYSFRIGRDG
jgi:hypothetical protein